MSEQNQHQLPVTDNKDILVLYYGIHDALRELGDDLHDAGDGPSLGIEHTIAGLWNASSALTRLFEQFDARERLVNEVRFYFDHLRREGVALTIGMEQALDALDGSNPASEPETCDCGHSAKQHYMESGHPSCHATVYTDAPLGGGSAYPCPCRFFRVSNQDTRSD